MISYSCSFFNDPFSLDEELNVAQSAIIYFYVMSLSLMSIVGVFCYVAFWRIFQASALSSIGKNWTYATAESVSSTN